MAEIAALRGTSGLRFVSTFSGMGGACLGLEMAGLQPLLASEFIPQARDVYTANHPGVPVIDRDIRTVTADEVLHAIGMRPGELDLLEGSPPCKAFSGAGFRGETSREKGWGVEVSYGTHQRAEDPVQRVDDLFFEFSRLLRGLKPRAFVAENVPGLVRGVAVGYFKEIMRDLTACGYRVSATVMDASLLGVPQKRKRLIFVGLRDDVPGELPVVAPSPHVYGVGEALEGVVEGRVVATCRAHWHRKLEDGTRPLIYFDPDEPSGTIVAKVSLTGVWGFYDLGIVVAPPGCTEDFSTRPEWISGTNPQDQSRYFASVKKARPAGSVEARRYNVAELKRICSFPDDFVLPDSLTPNQKWERFGRAVPPFMYRAVGRELVRVLGGRSV